MPTWQYQTHLNADQSVPVPSEVAAQMRADELVHVVLITGKSEEDANWERLAAEQFFQGYAPGDDVYDQLPTG